MKDALSMYLCDVVSAEECDFEDYKKLGLKCPICSEAVFLRSGTPRQLRKNGVVVKATLVSPSFCHYASSPDTWDCERRSLSNEGRNKIKAFQIEAHNQRLELYNNYLWEMFAEDRNVTRPVLASIRKVFGDRWINEESRTVHRLFPEALDIVHAVIVRAVEEYGQQSTLKKALKYANANNLPDFRQDLLDQTDYFAHRVNRKKHTAICQEICEFLSTRTAGYAFRKLFITNLQTATIAAGRTYQEQFGYALQGKPLTNAVKSITPLSMVEGIAGAIAGTHWIEIINKKLGEAHD